MEMGMRVGSRDSQTLNFMQEKVEHVPTGIRVTTVGRATVCTNSHTPGLLDKTDAVFASRKKLTVCCTFKFFNHFILCVLQRYTMAFV